MNNAEESAGIESSKTNTEERVRAIRMKIILLGVLAIVGSLVIFPLLIWGLQVGHSGSADEADGTPAVARVDRHGEGACWVGFKGSTCLLLRITVFPDGEEPFRAAVEVNVDDRWLSKVQPGSFVRIVRDRDDPSKVYLNTEALPSAAPTPPAAAAPNPPR